uniref:Putative cytochrome c biosynthesis ccmC-like mitochondrial protein n=2 Tax=Roya TaxID=43942 RepID=A0A6G9IEU4_9VIRI|nr:cytochrome c1 ABC transporter subunit [Roya obtusa]YP_009755743.1 subunit of ABC transporter for cytochrome c1 [Roya anglica]AGZ90399.1 cytochrome c1 ABC transporter subunit [Roya obtusa]QIQ22982.1 subunit of ABC transporter for cytochrome c1 [Roya anglica]
MHFEIFRPFFFMVFSFRYSYLLFTIMYFLLTITLYLCVFVAPCDFQQGENYRIIFLHVPVAWMSVFLYICSSILSFLFLINKHPIFSISAKIICKLGALFTFLTLITGSFWGKPMWGTFWVWDARLTSVLILFFIYLGALRFYTFSAEIASLFICIGLINIPIIKFSVNWWNTLHQPSSITQFGSSIHISMLLPILCMFFSLLLIFLLILCIELRKFILNSY